MEKISVFGAGLVGGFIAKTLATKYNFNVCAYDLNEGALNKLDGISNLEKYVGDVLQGNSFSAEIRNSDVVVNALPGNVGAKALKKLLENGKNVVDISFMPEDFFSFKPIAKNSVAVVDFGVAPGMSHLFTGMAHKILGKNNHAGTDIFVCGLPQNTERDYFGVFSPIDVLEEYRRPARIKSCGILNVEKPFDRKISYYIKKRRKSVVGFVSDGLRSLLRLPIPNMIEWTLRYAPHFQRMRLLRDQGCFNEPKIKETADSLFGEWKMRAGDKDFTHLCVQSYGLNGRAVCQELNDVYDVRTNTHSMARTTGLPAAIMAKMLARRELNLKNGLYFPEEIGMMDISEKIIKEMRRENVEIKIRY